MLDVVHEIDRERVLRAGIERREHARDAAAVDDPRLLEAGIERLLAHIFGAFLVIDPHVGDGRKLDPVAQPLDRLIVIGMNLGGDLISPRIAGRRARRHNEGCQRTKSWRHRAKHGQAS